MRAVRSPTADPKGSKDRFLRNLKFAISSLGMILLVRLAYTSSPLSESLSSPAYLRRTLASSSLASSSSSLASSLSAPFGSAQHASSSSSANAPPQQRLRAGARTDSLLSGLIGGGGSPGRAPGPANLSRVLEISLDNRNDLVYLHGADMMIMTMAKAGTSSTWHWIYPGVTGRARFDMKACKTYIHDIDGPCWRGEASFVYKLPPAEQWRIFTSPATLRVAIQRDPYSRLISSFKSKYTCEDERFGTDVHNRLFMVPALRRQAGWPAGKSCMNITEFAEALDATRRLVREGTGRLKSLRHMDVHIRPQEMYFDEIDYDMVLDVTDLWNVKNLQPIIKRLKYRQMVKDGITLRHSSGGSELLIPDRAASLLHNFALESKVGPVKYLAE